MLEDRRIKLLGRNKLKNINDIQSVHLLSSAEFVF